jgi:hypothetical protein
MILRYEYFKYVFKHYLKHTHTHIQQLILYLKRFYGNQDKILDSFVSRAQPWHQINS